MKNSNKLDRVEFERDRGYKVLVEKMKDNKKNEEGSDSDGDSTDEEHDMPGMKKRMTRRQRDEARNRTAGILKQTGSTFPTKEAEATSNAGNESETECKSKSDTKITFRSSLEMCS